MSLVRELITGPSVRKRRHRRRPTEVAARAESLEDRTMLSSYDIGVFRSLQNVDLGYWLFDVQHPGQPPDELQAIDFHYGRDSFNDMYVVGDWIGQGASAGVARPLADGNLRWLLDTNGDSDVDLGESPPINFGFSPGLMLNASTRVYDTPIVGDWNGDGTDDVGVFRIEQRNHGNGFVFHNVTFAFDHVFVDGSTINVVQSGNARFQQGWNGESTMSFDHILPQLGGIRDTDIPVVANRDGVGPDEVGIFRDGAFYFFNLQSRTFHDLAVFGGPGDKPVTGDWDNNGRDNVGVVRPSPNTTGFRAGLLHWYFDTQGLSTPARVYGFDDRVDGAFSWKAVDAGDIPFVVERWAGIPESRVDSDTTHNFSTEIINGHVLDPNNPDARLSFGTIDRSTSEAFKTFTVTNNGSATLTLGSVTISGGDSSRFRVHEPLSPSLAPQASDTFTIAVDRTLPGDVSSTIQFTSNEPDEQVFSFPIHASVQGPRLASFGFAHGATFPIGAANQEVQHEFVFTVGNFGNLPLFLGPLSMIDLDFPDGYTVGGWREHVTGGSVNHAGGFSLPPNAYADFTVRMDTSRPTTDQDQSRRGTVVFETNEALVPLDGSGRRTFRLPLDGRVLFEQNAAELGVWRDGHHWFMDLDRDPAHEILRGFGLPGDTPMPGFWSQTEFTQMAVVRPPSLDGLQPGEKRPLTWYIDTDEDIFAEETYRFGWHDDKPLAGDWNGDGISDFGVARPDDGQWRWLIATDRDEFADSLPEHPGLNLGFVFGDKDDIPIAGDWDGDNDTDIGVIVAPGPDAHPTWFTWRLLTNWNTGEVEEFQFGEPGHTPVVGDWDASGTTDVGVFWQFGEGPMLWSLDTNRNAHVEMQVRYGLPGDKPLVGQWLPPGRDSAISGVVWDDRNLDGVFNADEEPRAGARAYVDIDQSGTWTPGEEFAFSDSSGAFRIENLRPARYVVLVERPPERQATFPRVQGQVANGELNRFIQEEFAAAAWEQHQSLSTQATETQSADEVAPLPGSGSTDVGPLVRLPEFLSDPRFHNPSVDINGGGLALVVIDTGVAADHPAFSSGQVIEEQDFFVTTCSTDCGEDTDGHGTHVASVAAAMRDIAGLAPGATIINLKIFPDADDPRHPDGRTNLRVLEEALNWVVENAAVYNVAAVNMSLAAVPLGDNHPLRDEFDALKALNVITVAASGNDGDCGDGACSMELAFPASDPDVISVGASDGNRIADFTQWDDRIDIFAPGVSIPGANFNGGYTTFSGTSQAAPQVAAVAVLAQQMAQEFLGRRLTLDEFRTALDASTIAIDTTGIDASRLPAGRTLKRLDVHALADYIRTQLRATSVDNAYVVLLGRQSEEIVRFGDVDVQQASTPTGSVSGNVFDDENGNGRRDAGEGGLSGQRVFLDLNHDGVRNDDEPFDQTDGSGDWTFAGLGDEIFTVGVEPAGSNNWNQSGPVGIAVTDLQRLDSVDNARVAAIGRFNNDPHPDLVVGGPDGLRVHTASADGRFSAGGGSPTYPIAIPDIVVSVATADFDQNGFDDIVAAGDLAGTVVLHRVLGEGQFQEQELTIPEVLIVPRLATGDVNNDGVPDLLLTNGGSGTLYVWSGRLLATPGPARPGTAVTTGLEDVPAGPNEVNQLSVTVADVDGTGGHDVVIASALSDEVVILVSNGVPLPGTEVAFAAPVAIPADSSQAASSQSASPHGVAAADFDAPVNASGEIDAVVVNHNTHELVVIRSIHTASPIRTAYRLPEQPVGVESADINGDGYPDLIVVAASSEFPIALLNVDAGNGGREFSAPVRLGTVAEIVTAPATMSAFIPPSTADSRPPQLAFVNTRRDGADGGSDAPAKPLSVMQLDVGSGPVGVVAVNGEAVGDVDFGLRRMIPPGPAHLLARNNHSGDWHVLRSSGAAFTNEIAGRWAPSVDWLDVRTIDVNGDGNPDLAGRQQSNGNWWVALSNGATFTNQLWGRWAPIDWIDVNTADVNGDGYGDIVGRQRTNGAWWVGLSNGTSGFANRNWGFWTPIGWNDVKIADVNGDGNDDIVGRQQSNGVWWVALSNGTDGFTNQRWGFWAPIGWQDVNIADVNGDGNDDIVGRQQSNGVWWVALSNGVDGFTNQRWGFWTPIGWQDVRIADVNGDGHDDLVGRQQSNGDWWVGLSNGVDGFINQRWGGWAPIDWVDVTIADVDGDGRDDVVGRQRSDGRWWVGRSNGSGFANELWGAWSSTIDWADLRVLAPLLDAV